MGLGGYTFHIPIRPPAVVGVLTNNHENLRWWWGQFDKLTAAHQASGKKRSAVGWRCLRQPQQTPATASCRRVLSIRCFCNQHLLHNTPDITPTFRFYQM